MEAKTLSAEVRELRGKGPARQLRNRGLIPAVFYGPDTETVSISCSPVALEKLLSGKYARNQVIELDIAGDKKLAVVKDLEVDPVSRELLHADFYAVSEERPVTTTVPFETKGRALGVQKGAAMRKLYRELPVRAFPQNVPDAIVLDVAPLDLGAVVRVADLKLDEGVEVTYPPTRRVLMIEAKERKKKADEEEAAAAPAS
ncbi:MAG: 50S ribosomal protein L25 [Myxococcota bacterium]|nr:50S ribosomal protein L25 [Myxococcota bacterium]